MILLGQQIRLYSRCGKGPNGVDIHFLYKTTQIYSELEKFTTKNSTVNGIYNKTVGDYPYKQYSVIQGGGMEYAMCTLILGQGTFEGLLGVTARNGGFQHVLASNESSTVGWTKDLLHLEDFGLDAIADKSRKPIFGWL
jgi:hypothetical protein